MKQSVAKYFSFNDLLLIGALLVALGLAWNTITAMQRNYRLQQKYDHLKAEVELQQLENQNLKYNIAYLKTNDYLELAAREKFSKAAPGETLVYLPGSGAEQQAPVAKSESVVKVASSKGWRANVQAWWRFLQGKDKIFKT
jgi:cell division protein FtsB